MARLLLGAMLVVAVPVAIPSPASAEGPFSFCPAMTDSITRLYRAYLDRDPDPDGFNHWVFQYKNGLMSLEEISEWFAQSDEFQERGLGSNETYTNWLFRNLLERAPSEEEFRSWVELLNGGTRRGTVMLNFTESRDFVTRTGTAVPLAGFLKAYPKGTHWYCNQGSTTESVTPLVGEVWGDYYFYNRSGGDDSIGLWTLNADRSRNTRMVTGTLPGGFTDYNWDGVFRGNGDYGRSIEVQAGSTTDWIVVFYPVSIGEDRIGWQLS